MERILFVAPNEKMAETAIQVASHMGVELPIMVCK